MAPRLFVPKEQLPVISGSDVHYLKNVLRLKPGDQLELFDGSGNIFEAQINRIEKNRIICKILSSHHKETEPKIKVALAQSLPKASKMDFIVQKCTELGADKIIPMLSERSIPKSAKPDRWRKLAKEAAEQCTRATIPEIANLQTFEEVLKSAKQYNLALIPWELEKDLSLKQSLHSLLLPLLPPLPHILILVGPEGGFSQKEIELAKQTGFIPVSLGPRILRTETAGLAILSMINYEYEQ